MAVVYQDMAISKSLVFKNSFPFALQSAADMVSRSPLIVFRFLNGLLMVKTCSFFFFKVGKVLECVASRVEEVSGSAWFYTAKTEIFQ